jgi:cytochrome c2
MLVIRRWIWSVLPALSSSHVHGRERRCAAAVLALAIVTLTNASCIVLKVDLEDRYDTARARTGGEPHQGKEAIGRYGCGSCHTIPGIHGANANVGPSLSRVATRIYVAGVLANTPGNMARWIQDPPAIDDKTAMPKIGVSAKDARDIVAYLYTLH